MKKVIEGKFKDNHIKFAFRYLKKAHTLGMSVIWVNAQKARELLDALDSLQRPYRRDRAEMYAEQMKAGLWPVTGEPLIFSKPSQGGRMLNGQHRMHAVIIADVEIPFLVVTGVDRAAYHFMDCGANRSASDTLYSYGHKYSSIKASVARMMILFRNECFYAVVSGSGQDDTHSKLLTTNDQILHWCEEEPYTNEEAHKVHKLYTDSDQILTQALIGFGIKSHSEIDSDLADDFWTRLVLNTEIKKDEPLWTLRKTLVRHHTGPVKLRRDTRLSLVNQAWNEYRTGESHRVKGKFKLDRKFIVPV